MPIIEINMMKGRSLEQKRALVQKVTEAVCDTIGTTPDRVKIKLNDMDPGMYAIGGMLIMDQEDPFGKSK